MHPFSCQILSFHHVQLAMPAGQEEQARAFYAGVLGLTEVPKPPNPTKRGGVWFVAGGRQLHLGVEAGFLPARKAHPAYQVLDLHGLTRHLTASGITSDTDEPLPGHSRIYVSDPFGNRLEFLEPDST